MNKNDWLLFIGFLLIIAAMFSFGYYTIITNVNECTRDPLRYGVEQIRENYNATFVRGSISLETGSVKKSWYFGDEQIDFYNIGQLK